MTEEPKSTVHLHPESFANCGFLICRNIFLKIERAFYFKFVNKISGNTIKTKGKIFQPKLAAIAVNWNIPFNSTHRLNELKDANQWKS